MKCSLCGNVGEFLYIASRNVNERGEISDIVGDAELWISYYRCPECGKLIRNNSYGNDLLCQCEPTDAELEELEKEEVHAE